MKLNEAKETVATTFVMFMIDTQILSLLYQYAGSKKCYAMRLATLRETVSDGKVIYIQSGSSPKGVLTYP